MDAHQKTAWPADRVERRAYGEPRALRQEQPHTLGRADRSDRGVHPRMGVDSRRCSSMRTTACIAGHARVMAAKQLGLAEIPVMVAAGWSEAQTASLRHRRQQAGVQRRLGRGAAQDRADRASGARLRPRHDRLLARRDRYADDGWLGRADRSRTMRPRLRWTR